MNEREPYWEDRLRRRLRSVPAEVWFGLALALIFIVGCVLIAVLNGTGSTS